MKKTLTSYFSAGFALANRSMDLLVIAIFLSLVTSFLPKLFTPHTLLRLLSDLLGVIILIGYSGFSISKPIFFIKKQNREALPFQEILSTTLKNTKRLIIPAIAFGLAVFGLLIIIAIIAISRGGSASAITGTTMQFAFIPILMLFSLFSFSSIYFSLEDKGVLSSIKQSVKFSIRHFRFVFVIMLIMGLTQTFWAVTQLSINNIWGEIVRLIVADSENLLIAASSLIYYQAHKSSNH